MIPPDSYSLIDWLDRHITVNFSMDQLGSEADRLRIAHEKGKRELVDMLVTRMRQAKEEAAQSGD